MTVNNRLADEKVLDILNGCDGSLLHRETGNYFHSLHDLILHCVHAEIAILISLKKIANLPLFENRWSRDSEYYTSGENIFKRVCRLVAPADTEELFTLLRKADAEYEQIGRNIDDNTLMISGHLRGKDMFLYEPLFQVMNHQIHHRGQIAQILDEQGIENDYSGIWDRLEAMR